MNAGWQPVTEQVQNERSTLIKGGRSLDGRASDATDWQEYLGLRETRVRAEMWWRAMRFAKLWWVGDVEQVGVSGRCS